MVISYSSISDTGLVRNNNQDSIFADEKAGCGIFMVADGMGGHSRGELASGCAADVLSDWWRRNYTRASKADGAEIMNMLDTLVADMNHKVYEMYEQMDLRGGTTLAILLINESNYGIATVGDSRIYQSKGKVFRQISVDDVWENLPENMDLTEEMVVSDTRYGTLTQALGYDKIVHPRIQTDAIETNTVFFICSDGVYKYFSEKKIEKMLIRANKERNLSKRMEKMKRDVYKAGAGDNLSGVLVKIK